METKLAIAYAMAIEVIWKSLGRTAERTGIDFACGPGHFTINLARWVNMKCQIGVDLSSSMIEVAQRNMRVAQMNNVTFSVGDILEDGFAENAPFDLCTFTDAAHHFNSITDVRRIIDKMEDITALSGLVFVMDLVRLRTASVTERYVNLLGQDYTALGLPDFLDEFRDSMYAAWTVEEFRRAVPEQSPRCWYHLIPCGLPTLQMLVGLPVGRRRLFVRRSHPWGDTSNPVPARMRWEWRMLRQSLFWGHKVLIDRVSSRSSALGTPRK